MVRLGWRILLLVLYSSSGGHGKVGLEDAYVGPALFEWWAW